MAAQGRIKTKFPGVYYTEAKSTRRYYVVFKRCGKYYEEAAKVLINGGPETRPAENPQEASAWRFKRITEVEAEESSAKSKKMTVDDLWKLWVDGRLEDRKVQATISRYSTHVGRFFGTKEIEDLCDFDVTRFRRDLEQRGLSPATVKLCMTLLATLLKWGAAQKLIKAQDLRFDYPRFDNKKTEFMSRDQLEAYKRTLDEWPDQDVANYYKIMLLTGVRRRALSAVRWTDIDLDRGFLTLRADTAKSGKTKTIPIPPVVAGLFKNMLGNDSAYVWPDGKGGFRDMGEYGKEIREAAGLPEDFRPCHGLRHTFASMLASSGKVDMPTLQQLLTYDTPEETQRYSHLNSSALRNAASATEQIFSEDGNE